MLQCANITTPSMFKNVGIVIFELKMLGIVIWVNLFEFDKINDRTLTQIISSTFNIFLKVTWVFQTRLGFSLESLEFKLHFYTKLALLPV